LLANAQCIHTQRWARYFVERGHSVSVISFDPGDLAGVAIHALARRTSLKPLAYLWALPRIRRLLTKIRPDILHAHYAISYGVLGYLSGFRPLVIGAWGSDVLVSPRGSKARWAVLSRALRSADLVTSLAGHITQTMVDHGVPRQKIETLPFGVDTNVFYPPEDGQLRSVDVICTRKLEPIYDIDTLLRALVQVISKRPTLRCVLAGDGPSRQSLRALAAQLKIEKHILWLGWIPSRELAAWLRRSEIYVSPSLSDGTSTALTEAMACGCYPIVSDIAANRPWIEAGKTGLLFPPSDADALAGQILHALEAGELRRSVISINRQTVEMKANWHKIMAGIEERYWQLARKTQLNDLHRETRTGIENRVGVSD
jgi:glycosyltransferase involved in cell wall biosynthesis